MKDGRRFGCPPNPYEPAEVPGGKINTTDPNAGRMKFGRNFTFGVRSNRFQTGSRVPTWGDPVRGR
jgi:hypothetical protein